MAEGHDLTRVSAGSYRFVGYKLNRDSNNNIIREQQKICQPEYWRTRAVTGPVGHQPYEAIGSK